MTFTVRRFQAADQIAVERLVLGIQQQEFGLALTAQNQPDLADVAAFFAAPGSAFWVGVNGAGAVIGCIGLEALDAETAVMRKFMVDRQWRGSGAGVSAALVGAFEDHAAQAGFTTIALSTVSATKAAQRFYEKAGYLRVEKADLPPAYAGGVLDSVFFRKAVIAPSAG